MERSNGSSAGASFDLPTQREYDPVRDEHGKELPHYYGEYEPVADADAETQDAINRAGSIQVRAVLAALKEARERNKNNTSA